MVGWLVSLLWSCGGGFGSGDPTDLSGDFDPRVPHPSCLEDSGLVLETPSTGSFMPYKRKGFGRYAQVVAPSGGVIPVFAQEQVSDAKLLRARSLLKFFLTNVPGSTWGADKSAVANAMAENEAVLMMPNGAHEEGNEPNLPAQPLYDAEMPLEGSDWFMNNDFEHRDAGFEEIFHLVHDAGVGTYMQGALPEYQADLDAEARAAIADGRWGREVEPGVQEWIAELDREDSLAQEYIASVIDSYYGLWGSWDEADGGMWGVYIAKTREEMTTLDPAGLALLEQFLPAYIPTEVRLDSSLDQDFTLTFSESTPYTHKSRYFLHVTLTGSAGVALTGNDLDNHLRGNAGDNVLDGGEGEDTVIYCQPKAAYEVERSGDEIRVEGDGGDVLHRIEWVHFSDGRVAVEDL